MTTYSSPPENLSSNHTVLDLRTYWAAIRDGEPLPLFAQPNVSGLPDRRAIRYLKADKQAHIVSSPLSAKFYEQAHRVDRLIVRDVRRRALESA
ncbi:hypothetical protein [Sphingomonas sp. Leaf34]|uniref:hypothetical protein n=1 Tax=Sphingomonas sp. Leaf34 TaxID=1736216 RepID=UPI0012E18B21|nr:hypothetical protein [Sphingomonas sp. Leaf34]